VEAPLLRNKAPRKLPFITTCSPPFAATFTLPNAPIANIPSHIKAVIAKNATVIELFAWSLRTVWTSGDSDEIVSKEDVEEEEKAMPDLWMPLLKMLNMIVVAKVPPRLMAKDITDTMEAICVG
jgi:hypothetical protein